MSRCGPAEPLILISNLKAIDSNYGAEKALSSTVRILDHNLIFIYTKKREGISRIAWTLRH